jgi:hypothetical protein
LLDWFFAEAATSPITALLNAPVNSYEAAVLNINWNSVLVAATLFSSSPACAVCYLLIGSVKNCSRSGGYFVTLYASFSMVSLKSDSLQPTDSS